MHALSPSFHSNYVNEGAWPARFAGYQQISTIKLYESLCMVVRYLARLVSGLLPRRPEHCLGLVHVRIVVVDEGPLGQLSF